MYIFTTVELILLTLLLFMWWFDTWLYHNSIGVLHISVVFKLTKTLCIRILAIFSFNISSWLLKSFFLHVIHITFQSEVTKISSIVSYFTQEIDECQVKYNQKNTGMKILFNQQVLSGKQMNIWYGLSFVSVYRKLGKYQKHGLQFL